MMHRFSLFLLFLTSLPLGLVAQDSAYVRRMIDSLCAPRYHGRGYVAQGDVKAADFLIRQSKEIGLAPLNGKFSHPFTLSVNTFPAAMDLTVNGNNLETGLDYIPDPASGGVDGSYKAFYLKPKWTGNREKLFKLSHKQKVQERMVVLDETDNDPENQAMIARLGDNPLDAQGYVILTDKKLTWAVGRQAHDVPIIRVTKDSLQGKVKRLDMHVDQVWLEGYQTKNVTTYIPGRSDTMVVFTAHYDHLGRMGKDTYIAGASDNASGSAMLLDLARYYQKNRPHYTMVFLWFAGEEAGLVGSLKFVEDEVIDLEKIKFLLNLDLMADAKEGITVVNGKIFFDQFRALEKLNESVGKLGSVKARGAAANSDHYPFSEKGVPSFFIYTRGDYKHYHDVHDVPENIPLTNYGKVFELLTAFVHRGI